MAKKLLIYKNFVAIFWNKSDFEAARTDYKLVILISVKVSSLLGNQIKLEKYKNWKKSAHVVRAI